MNFQELVNKAIEWQLRSGKPFEFYTEIKASLRLPYEQLRGATEHLITPFDMPVTGPANQPGAVIFTNCYFTTDNPRLAVALAYEPELTPGAWFCEIATPEPAPPPSRGSKK